MQTSETKRPNQARLLQDMAKGLVRLAAAVLPIVAASGAGAAELKVLQVADYSGSRARLGSALRYGAELAIKAANRAGGVGGNTIELVALDDQYKPDETVRLIEQGLARHDPLAIVNILGTGNTARVLRDGILDRAGIALIGPYTGADSLRAPLQRHVFDVRVSYGEEVDRIAHHFASIGVKRVGILREAGPFGEAIAAAFDAAVKKHGLEIVARGVTPEGSDDVTAAVAEVARIAPDGVLIGTAGSPTARLVKETARAGMLAARIGLSVNDVGQIIEAAGPAAARGFGMVAVMPDPGACNLQICKELREEHAQHGDPSQSLTSNTMEGFVSARAFLAALGRVRGEPTRPKLRDALEQSGRLDLGGMVLEFTPTRHNGSSYMDIGVIGSGGRMMY